MEEMLNCQVLQPIKVGDMIVTQGRIELPPAIAREESAAGRVEILEGDAGTFTPSELRDGVVEVEQNSMAAPAADGSQADDGPGPGGGDGPAAGTDAPRGGRKAKGR